MHDQIVRRNVKPLENLGEFQGLGMLCEKPLIIEPDNIIVIDVVSKMLVTNIFIGAVRRTANPGEKAPQRRVVPDFSKYQIVPTLVDHVSRDSHRMR